MTYLYELSLFVKWRNSQISLYNDGFEGRRLMDEQVPSFFVQSD